MKRKIEVEVDIQILGEGDTRPIPRCCSACRSGIGCGKLYAAVSWNIFFRKSRDREWKKTDEHNRAILCMDCFNAFFPEAPNKDGRKRRIIIKKCI